MTYRCLSLTTPDYPSLITLITWKTRAHDFNVTTEKTLHTKLDYMHKNPITRRLVERADQWIWSSYRYYEYDDASVIVMDWDGSWPIV